MLACTAFRGAPAMLARPRNSPNLRTILRGQLPPIQRCYRVGSTGPYTLDPARLRPSDYLDLTGVCRKAILSAKIRPRPTIAYLPGYFPPMQSEARMRVQFPPDARGFLYYHPPADGPPLNEGHLRFRITGNSDPASFSHGKDLLYPDGEPWNLAGGRLATTAKYVALRRMLLDEGLVTEAQLDAWGSHYFRGMRQNVLHDLETPFVIDFALETHTFNIPISPHSDKTRRYVLIHPLTVRRAREKTRPVSLCTGRAICRFENAGVHGKKDEQSRVVLRLLKVLKPLEHSEEALKRGIFFDRPKEGGLFKRSSKNRTWTRLTKYGSLHSLWESWASERKDVGAGAEHAE